MPTNPPFSSGTSVFTATNVAAGAPRRRPDWPNCTEREKRRRQVDNRPRPDRDKPRRAEREDGSERLPQV